MTDLQCCQQAATASPCLKKASLTLIPYQLELIRTAAEAHRRVLDTRAISPDWQAAYSAWLNAAESLAVAIIHQAAREARRHD
ncbi:hypothetical protein [Geopseudomonas guangdongensis]|uniref:Uncharacterized protein n=1 Tax=Geopseudomonas guangdongensis TaxID=1245526 RepID=A0A1H2GJT3_9GAMM|nr:hypothetical protein [Pseudomonas guangdongensis]SDU19671.1 hypothetical protein SAMN05216580_1816 [Pseudomonas guangdongensis]